MIALAGCLKDPNKPAFCFGTDTGNSAYLGTKELIKAMGGKRRIAHFTGFLVDPNTQLRIDAVAKAAKEAAREVVQVIADIDAPEPAEEKINAYLAAHAQRSGRHRHHRLGAGGRGLELSAQDRRQAHQDGRHRP